MTHKPLTVLLAAMLLAAGAVAQQPPAPALGIVGSIAKVQGLVTVSVGTTVANVASDSPIIDGSRYVTSSTGRADLGFKDGCNVTLGPNQWTSVDASTDCATRQSAVVLITDSSGGAGLGGSGSGIGPFLTSAALLLGGAGAGRSGGGGSGSGSGSNIPVPPITPPPAQ